MKELVQVLNNASEVYYNSGEELMSNFEFDQKMEELEAMEKATGKVLPDSPTQNVGYQVMDKLNKVVHEYPALSLDKTKDLKSFVDVFNVSDRNAVIMWKLDGSTVVATYNGGKLLQLATRGNGEVGQDITHNAKTIKGLPLTIPYKDKLVVRGEAVMSYTEFNRINATLPDGVEPYKNPRNLANSTISLLDSRIAGSREIVFKAFTMVAKEDGMPMTVVARLQQLELYGFGVVEYAVSDINLLVCRMSEWGDAVENYDFPVDGLVVAANDAEYAEKQPGTGHNPNKLVGYALKWEDETAKTTLRDIEWSASRTGLLNPVAVFDPVELEGTTVTRASVHNVSEVERLHLMIGDEILVYKANKIIPQILDNLSEDTGLTLGIYKCPICGFGVDEVTNKSVGKLTKTLWCKNPTCAAKHVGKYVHFCERDCMNIEGMSEATIEKLVTAGYIKEFADIYKLDRYKDEIISMEGFGQKSYDKLQDAIRKSVHTSFVPFVHALGIPNIGKGQAKLLNKAYNGDVSEFFEAVHNRRYFQSIDGIGEVLEDNLWCWGNKMLRWIPWGLDDDAPNCNLEIRNLVRELTFETAQQLPEGNTLEGKIFVITGDVHIFKNRAELQEKIESLGGKATGSVTGKTSYLINNDVNSTSGKNQKAKELGIPIISEEQFMKFIR